MLRLNIEQTFAKLAIKTQPAIFQLKNTLPKLQIETAAAKLDIQQPLGELQIDQYPSRSVYGYKNFLDLTFEISEQAKRDVVAATERIVDEGNRLARIENKEDAIQAIATERLLSDEEAPEVGLVSIPSPKINYIPRPPKINVTPGEVNFDLQRGRVELEYEPAVVHGQMAQYNSIRMWTTDSRLDIRI